MYVLHYRIIRTDFNVHKENNVAKKNKFLLGHPVAFSSHLLISAMKNARPPFSLCSSPSFPPTVQVWRTCVCVCVKGMNLSHRKTSSSRSEVFSSRKCCITFHHLNSPLISSSPLASSSSPFSARWQKFHSRFLLLEREACARRASKSESLKRMGC